MLPDKTNTFRGEECTATEKAKDRVTRLVCANMTGTEKCSLLTIGKYKKPRCFYGVSILPTEYEASPNAWMTAALFETWLQKWNRLARHGRMIVLFIDNCTAHPHIEDLESIELIFPPPNMTSQTGMTFD